MKKTLKELTQLLGHRQRRPDAPLLGARELEVMKILWQQPAQSAHQILQCNIEDAISLSTIQSTLERLHRKQLVARNKVGRAYLYSATVDRSTFISQLLGVIATQISDGEMAPMVSGFMSFMDQEAPDALPATLRQAIQQPADDDD